MSGRDVFAILYNWHFIIFFIAMLFVESRRRKKLNIEAPFVDLTLRFGTAIFLQVIGLVEDVIARDFDLILIGSGLLFIWSYCFVRYKGRYKKQGDIWLSADVDSAEKSEIPVWTTLWHAH